MEVLYHSATHVGFDAAGGEEWALSSWWPGPFWSNRSVALLYFPVETRHKTCPRACEKATLIRARPIYLYAPRFVGVGGNLLNAALFRMVCYIFLSLHSIKMPCPQACERLLCYAIRCGYWKKKRVKKYTNNTG